MRLSKNLIKTKESIANQIKNTFINIQNAISKR